MTPNIDFSSSQWLQLQRWAEAELAQARERNDARALSIEATSVLRGEISVWKKILDLPKQAARDNGIVPD